MSSQPGPNQDAGRNPETLYVFDAPLIARRGEAFALRKGDPDALNFFNNWIAQEFRSGWLDERHDYWFASDEWADGSFSNMRSDQGACQRRPPLFASRGADAKPVSATEMAGLSDPCHSRRFFAYVWVTIQGQLNYSWRWHLIPNYIIGFHTQREEYFASLLLQGLIATIRICIYSANACGDLRRRSWHRALLGQT